MTRSLYVLVFAATATVGASVQGQARPQQQDPKPAVPRTHLPPPGMCRIWLDNVPPAQQPAPTDCASAVRNLPRNGRLIYNDEPRVPKLPIKSLKDPEPAPRKAPDQQPATTKPVGPDGKPVKPDKPQTR